MAKMKMSEYASYRGVSRAAVCKAVKSGRISVIVENDKRFIDPVVADIQWEQNSDISKKTTPTIAEKKSRNAAREASEEIVPRGTDEPQGSPPASVAGSGDFNTSKAMKESFLALTAELNYKKEIGVLISATEVEETAFRLARQVREALMNIPVRISSELAAETDSNKIFEKLNSEFRQALEELAGA